MKTGFCREISRIFAVAGRNYNVSSVVFMADSAELRPVRRNYAVDKQLHGCYHSAIEQAEAAQLRILHGIHSVAASVVQHPVALERLVFLSRERFGGQTEQLIC